MLLRELSLSLLPSSLLLLLLLLRWWWRLSTAVV
jgi:hypothetical protein|tara:strand:- start:184 stop:285 length:102 start_codon:yes stop_codon:yes gene_type:complete